MNARFIPCCLAIAFAALAFGPGAARGAGARKPAAQPALDLSVPHEIQDDGATRSIARRPQSAEDEAATRNLRAVTVRQPYGTGYEARRLRIDDETTERPARNAMWPGPAAPGGAGGGASAGGAAAAGSAGSASGRSAGQGGRGRR